MENWLEKQGNNPQKTSIWKHWKDGIAGNGEGEPIYLIKYGYTYSLSSCLCFECDYIELSELEKILSEKQSDKEEPQVYKTEDGEVITYSESEGYKVVEPKFKRGDWILYSGDHYEGVRHITKINENGYYIERNGLPHGIIPFNHEICMRLWTIQDAKDGDVLASKDKVDILIYKSHSVIDLLLTSYVSFSKCEGFCLRQYSAWDSNEFIPATKEQRDLLFQKMHEAGYEWDVEKKELKKISQRMVSAEAKEALYDKPAWSEEDNLYYDDICEILINLLHSERTDINKVAIKKDLDWLWHIKEKTQRSLDDVAKEVTKNKETAVSFLKSCGIMNANGELADEYKIKQDEQKSAWSEEDDMMIEETLYFLREYQQSNRCKDENGMQNSVTCEHWLKSLKDRVQPKQEWNEEDNKWINSLIETFKDPYFIGFDQLKSYGAIDWLKSLKERIGG